MDQNNPNQPESVSQPSAELGNVRNDSETFGTFRKGSEAFRTVRNDSAEFGNVPKHSEKNENHTLTVREAARMFEAAGVARTERSIVNWCQLNPQGVARLDAYFDPNERKYYITPQSIERAIQEERAKATKANEPSEPVGILPKDAERPQKPSATDSETDPSRIRELEKEVIDLKITNRGKDFFIDQLQKERSGVLNQLLDATRKVGELETRLLQLEPPKREDAPDRSQVEL